MAVFVDEQTEAGISGLRALKDAGSPQWCWQTISYLQTIWKSLDLDYTRYIEAWAEAEEHKVWEKVPYVNPFGTKEEMLKQLALVDDKQAQRRMAVQPIAHRVRKRYGSGGDLEKRRGNTIEHLLERILAKSPEIFERYERGEFRSAPAAAQAAGVKWEKRQKTMTLSDNVERVADKLRSHYSPEQLRRIRERLDAEGE